MALRQCSSAHCSTIDREIAEICRLDVWTINHPVLTRDAQGPCYCTCSCLAFGTPVQEGNGSFKAIETYVEGDQIMAAGTSLDWSPRPVVFSAGTTGASRQKYTVLVFYGDTAIAVTSDHLFMLAVEPRELRRADRLTTDDVLVAADGRPMPVLSVHIGDYLAGFHHVSATSKQPPDESMDGHLLNTNGVVSADYTVQVMARRQDVAGFSMQKHADLPVIGSAEYVQRYGRGALQAPAEARPDTNIRTAGFNSQDLETRNNLFVPAEAIALRIPDDACS